MRICDSLLYKSNAYNLVALLQKYSLFLDTKASLLASIECTDGPSLSRPGDRYPGYSTNQDVLGPRM